MSLTAIRRYSLAERIERAERLCELWPSAGEVLKTCECALRFQQDLRTAIDNSNYEIPVWNRRLPRNIDLCPFLSQFLILLHTISASATEVLADAATNLQSTGTEYWEKSLSAFWNAAPMVQTPETFFLHVFLQPVAEYFAERSELSLDNYSRPICPYCGRRPVCGVLRPLGDGAKRSLICSFCSTEWDYRRLVCPGCEQEDVQLLPVYRASDFAHIRVEACDACKTFIKTIDLSQQGHAIPVIDEMASLSLTLWAERQGYQKLEGNLLLT